MATAIRHDPTAQAALQRTTFFNTRRGRILRENLTAYLLLSPAIVLIFIFGIFPVGFAFFVSLHTWRRFPGDYVGISQYVRGLDGLAYILFFWIGVGVVVYGLRLIVQLFQQPDTKYTPGKLRAILYLVPGAISAAAALLFLQWSAFLLPIILNIPQRIRGQERVPGLFVSELGASFQDPQAVAFGNNFLLLLVLALVVSLVWMRVVRGVKPGTYAFWAASGAFAVAVGVLTLQLTVNAINSAVTTARAAGSELPIWSQIIIISAGVGMVIAAYFVWRRAVKSETNRRFAILALAAVLMAAGGIILAMELPRVMAESDPDVLNGFVITVMFVLGTVPFQLAIGLGLAVLMFQNIKGKSLFRMIYFLPYIMPFVATSIVFNLIFSHRSSSLVNQAFTVFGLPTQKWLLEPRGLGTLFANGVDAGVLAGPSLALVVIMIYSVWTYIGYNAVVFLAGLGGIPNELNEAARIDGANGWSIFRHITLPMLSPTTFFLSMIAVIGTFQAFTQIWIMRTPAAANSVDTIGVYIFETVRNTDPNMGYASALSFVLFAVILGFTLVQNRLQGRNVFYG